MKNLHRLASYFALGVVYMVAVSLVGLLILRAVHGHFIRCPMEINSATVTPSGYEIELAHPRQCRADAYMVTLNVKSDGESWTEQGAVLTGHCSRDNSTVSLQLPGQPLHIENASLPMPSSRVITAARVESLTFDGGQVRIPKGEVKK